MADNLLKNAGFEADWSDGGSHDALVFAPSGGAGQTKQVGNIFTPPGWSTWYIHKAGVWDQPEVRDAHQSVDARRVHSGEKAILLFTFYRAHDAGFMQRVEVMPGARLRFTAWAHAWSAHELAGHADCVDNGACSSGVGKGAFFELAGDDDSTLTGDPWLDAIPNFRFQVGIDPTGGLDPRAPSVVWGQAAHVYNEHAKLPAVEAVAAGDVVTVWLRAKTLWQFKHNDGYWDDAELVEVEVPPTPEPPPAEPGRGAPREQYERTYVLLPPDADAAWALAVVGATWDDKRFTLGGSADDAGIGDLDVRRVLAVNPSRWGGDLLAWFAGYYPGVEVEAVNAETPAQLARVLSLPGPTPNPEPPADDVHLCQLDEPWAGVKFNGGRCETIAYRGCWLDCMAMARRWYGIDKSATPLTVDAALSPDDFTDCAVEWAAMPKVGLRVVESTIDAARAAAHVAAGDVAFVDVLPGGPKHFVMAVGVADGRFWVHDPLIHAPCWLDERYGQVDSYRLIAKSDEPPEFPLRGMNDIAGGEAMVARGLAGWCLEPFYIGLTPRSDARIAKLAEAGIRVLVNLRYSWARSGPDGGGQGTLPPWGKIGEFVDACAETMRLNPAAWGFVLANEFNHMREWPADDDMITPERYKTAYNLLYTRKPGSARLLPGAIDPYHAAAPSWGDWRITWRAVLDGLVDCDGLTFHGYTHGPDAALITGDRCFGDQPLMGVFYDMRVLEDQEAIVPAKFASRPRIVTEANHLTRADGSIGWEASAGPWVAAAYGYARSRGFDGFCFFRYDHDLWSFKGLAGVVDAVMAGGES